MPSGNCLRVCFSIFSANFGCIILAVRLATSASRVMPSIISKGSSTLPLDLDIFWFSESRTSPCIYTCLKGTCPVNLRLIMIIRATQKKIISKPVTRTLVGLKFFSASVCSGQPWVEKVQSAEENQVSRTSSSCRNTSSVGIWWEVRTSVSFLPT